MILIILFALDYIHTMYYNTKNLKVVNVRYSPQRTHTNLDLSIIISSYSQTTLCLLRTHLDTGHQHRAPLIAQKYMSSGFGARVWDRADT